MNLNQRRGTTKQNKMPKKNHQREAKLQNYKVMA